MEVTTHGYRAGVNLHLAVLGDSIGAGQGASTSSEALGPRLVAGLSSRGIGATVRVFARPGARSSSLATQVDKALRWAPQVGVIVVGANDLSHRRPPEVAARELGDAVRRLRAGGAEVVVAPAPDLSTVPHVPAALRPVVRTASMQLRDAQITRVLAEGGRVAEAEETSLAFAADPSLFSPDRFHPSSAGYAVIAAALLPEVVSAVTAYRETQRHGEGR
jgi:lysophospholipase L1-like esterase